MLYFLPVFLERAGVVEIGAVVFVVAFDAFALGVAEKKCMTCHDLDNDPNFHLDGAFAKYWKKVEHKGKN